MKRLTAMLLSVALLYCCASLAYAQYASFTAVSVTDGMESSGNGRKDLDLPAEEVDSGAADGETTDYQASRIVRWLRRMQEAPVFSLNLRTVDFDGVKVSMDIWKKGDRVAMRIRHFYNPFHQLTLLYDGQYEYEYYILPLFGTAYAADEENDPPAYQQLADMLLLDGNLPHAAYSCRTEMKNGKPLTVERFELDDTFSEFTFDGDDLLETRTGEQLADRYIEYSFSVQTCKWTAPFYAFLKPLFVRYDEL